MIKERLTRCWNGLASMQVTIVAMALLMALVLLCTLAQTDLGTFGAVNVYMRSWFVKRWFGSIPFPIPVFPGGALVGLVLVFNLTAALIKRIDFNWSKSGLWLAHAGLILLVAGEFSTGAFQVETNMSIEEGQTVNWLESPREFELAVTDVTDPNQPQAYGIPETLLRKGKDVPLQGTPLSIKVKAYYPNSTLTRVAPGETGAATQGVGAQVRVAEAPLAATETEVNMVSALVEPVAGGRSYGVWLASNGIGAPQTFTHEGRTYALAVQNRRWYLPYSLTLKKFSHDVYPGTNKPKNFSSLVHLSNPAKNEARDVLIYMNQPLRYEGRAFYQASFGKGDKLTILQVVQNPGWLMPYISCTLITIGLLFHFGLTLRRSMKRRQAQQVTA
ncbi:MAG TPA: cytochrome c biogenesis protein ResB [Holophaga sp.]|nr:cytochrome c biogenesis protein ResB [Holophaga sp.]